MLNWLKESNLKLKLQKCRFIRQEVQYLQHLIILQCVKTNPDQIGAVANFSYPQTVTRVRRFLGLASYYHHFIPKFTATVQPLHSLTHKNASFQWSKKCQFAFESLKIELTQASVLAYPNFDVPFVQETDVSIYFGSRCSIVSEAD